MQNRWRSFASRDERRPKKRISRIQSSVRAQIEGLGVVIDGGMRIPLHRATGCSGDEATIEDSCAQCRNGVACADSQQCHQVDAGSTLLWAKLWQASAAEPVVW